MNPIWGEQFYVYSSTFKAQLPSTAMVSLLLLFKHAARQFVVRPDCNWVHTLMIIYTLHEQIMHISTTHPWFELYNVEMS